MSKNYSLKLHYVAISILLLFASFSSFSQGFFNTTNWRFSNPKQFGFTVLDVDYFDNNNVLAVGSDGGIAKSTDGGSNWTYGVFTYVNPQSFVTKSTFYDVHFVTSTIAYAVGDRGCMAKTTDGGNTWTFLNNPLFANSKIIYACNFLDANKGYIGGQFNTLDSLPKLYVTLNGGASWDSISAPSVNGVTRCGYINNPNVASVLLPVDAKAKEIHRIEFSSNGIGYVCGSGSPLFPRVSVNALASPSCAASTGNLTTGAHTAALLWKLQNGVLTDYSISKERIGYTGINTGTVTCTTGFGNLTPAAQTYKAMNIINDSIIVMMSFNNNTVVRVRTGVNDLTPNLNNANALEKGKYEVLNFPFPPTTGPNAGPPIPATQVLFASNPYHLIRNSAGTLVTGSFNNIGGPGYLWTSTDTGRNWVQRNVYPQGLNWSPVASAPALDFAPNGKLLVLGSNGVVGDSTSGGTWQSNYSTTPLSASYNDMEFADCNNGIAAGGSSITVTTDGGNTWIDRANSALAGLFANITSVTYRQINKAYFTTNIGTIYRSVNQGVSLVPAFIDNYGGTSTINDLAVIGNDSIWACGVQQNSSSVPVAANRFGLVYRSFNNGVTWDTVKVGPLGTTGTPSQTLVTWKGIEFPSKNIGYMCGNKGSIYKTTDAGATWTNISPFPTLNISPTGFPNSSMNYSDIQALDENTVFVIGNFFTTVNNRRIYKTTDGGASWVDISSNIDLLSSGNLNGILMHDVNNGYVVVPGGVLYKTTNGGTSWVMDLAPTNSLFTALAFAPRTVPSAISMVNRKLFVCGPNLSGAPMLEFGNPADITVNSTETITNANCTNLTAGAITINTTGGIVPYSYSINGGPFQSSNSFTGLTQGPKTITIKDAFCGTLTKTINVGFNDNLVLTTSNDTSVCAGAPVPMLASTNGTGATYTWTPTTGLSAANVANPTAIINNATVYNVTASLNGCTRNKNINVGIRPNPSVNAGPDFTIVSGDDVTLLGSGALNVVNINWTPATNIISGSTTFSPIVKPPTTTTFTLTVKDANSCTSTDNAIVTVIPYCVGIKDAFTPNGDGVNDRWLVTNGAACTNQIIAEVYNRYGGLVYRSDNYSNNWDGTYNGKPVADGTYYYKVTFRLINGKTIFQTGNVTILR